MMNYQNPVIRGFYPDPSVCREGDRYYLVCSSFQYFPGVPLFESRDLVHWNQIGHVLTRENQLSLGGAGRNGGIYAPTIRYHQGRFYMVTTNVSGSGNFFVWTEDIHGEWSNPIEVEQGGIDPSLYFEGERMYFVTNQNDDSGRLAISQCELDSTTGKKLGETKCIWYGSGGRYLESPHMYRIGDWYYLMAAEGGTEYGHMVVLARSKSLYGPFEGQPDNPVLTNRNLGDYILQGTGHGDLVCDREGNWWMVHLAFRQSGKWSSYHHLGRETCLVPVEFRKDGWMEVGIQGTCRLSMKTERPGGVPMEGNHLVLREEYTFQNTQMGIEWCFLRNPQMERYQWNRDDETGSPELRLMGSAFTLDETEESPSFLGIRQQEMKGRITVDAALPEDGSDGETGLSLYMDAGYHYDLALVRKRGQVQVLLRRTVGDMQFVQNTLELPKEAAELGELQLAVDCTNEYYDFQAGEEEMGKAQTRFLSSEVAGGFTGVFIGLYGVGSGWSRFSQFSYCPVREEEPF